MLPDDPNAAIKILLIFKAIWRSPKRVDFCGLNACECYLAAMVLHFCMGQQVATITPSDSRRDHSTIFEGAEDRRLGTSDIAQVRCTRRGMLESRPIDCPRIRPVRDLRAAMIIQRDTVRRSELASP